MKHIDEVVESVVERWRRLDANGHEVLDTTPVAAAVGYHRTPSLAEQIREIVRSERLAQEVAAAGYETADEADDFDIPDDPLDPSTPYEAYFDPAPPPVDPPAVNVDPPPAPTPEPATKDADAGGPPA